MRLLIKMLLKNAFRHRLRTGLTIAGITIAILAFGILRTVVEVSYGSWFGAFYKEEKNFFANFAMEPGSHLDIVTELLLKPDEREAYIKDRRGALAGRKLAGGVGWGRGGPITPSGAS